MKLFKTKKEKKQKVEKLKPKIMVVEEDKTQGGKETLETIHPAVKKEEQKVNSQKKPPFSSLATRFEVVKLKDGTFSYKNLDTGEILNRKFYYAGSMDGDNHYGNCNVRTQKQDSTHAIYFPETDTLLSARSNGVLSFREDLTLCPTDFDLLPTRLFRDQNFIDDCLGYIADGLKELADQNGSTKELETYTQEIVDLVSQKIEKEKANIVIEDERRLQENVVTPEQIQNVDRNINTIRNLGRSKND